MATIPTASLFRAAMRSSFSGCWRPLAHDIPGDPSATRDGARSPFRVVEAQTGREVEWVNRFLDRECARCLAETTLRSVRHGSAALSFAGGPRHAAITAIPSRRKQLASVLPDYVRFQAASSPDLRPPPSTAA
jgi:hypothetical protein